MAQRWLRPVPAAASNGAQGAYDRISDEGGDDGAPQLAVPIDAASMEAELAQATMANSKVHLHHPKAQQAG